jgi:hypothetical protein
VEGSCEHSNEPSGSIKCSKFSTSCTVGGFSRTAQHELPSVFSTAGETKKYFLQTYDWKFDDVDWIHLAQNRYKGRAVVNAVMSHGFQ